MLFNMFGDVVEVKCTILILQWVICCSLTAYRIHSAAVVLHLLGLPSSGVKQTWFSEKDLGLSEYY